MFRYVDIFYFNNAERVIFGVILFLVFRYFFFNVQKINKLRRSLKIPF